MVRKRKAKRKSRNGFDNMLGLDEGFGFGTFVKSKGSSKNGSFFDGLGIDSKGDSMFGLKMPKNKATGGLSIPSIAKNNVKGFDVSEGFGLPTIEIGMTREMFDTIPQDFDEPTEQEPEMISRNFPRDRALEGLPPDQQREPEPQRELSDEELDELDRSEEQRQREGADVENQSQNMFGEEEEIDDQPSLFDSLVDKSLERRVPLDEEDGRAKGFENRRLFDDDFEDTRFKQLATGAAPIDPLEQRNFRRGRSFGGRVGVQGGVL